MTTISNLVINNSVLELLFPDTLVRCISNNYESKLFTVFQPFTVFRMKELIGFRHICEAVFGRIPDHDFPSKLSFISLRNAILPRRTVSVRGPAHSKSDPAGVPPLPASIWLGTESMNCTVVGIGNESVMDEGENNKVSGMKYVPGGGHIGPTIRDNFQMWQRGRHH